MAKSDAQRAKEYRDRGNARRVEQEKLYRHGVNIESADKDGVKGILATLVLSPEEWIDLEERADDHGMDVDDYVGEIIRAVVQDYVTQRRAKRGK